MTQEDYIKRGIEKFKALDDKAQTDLIDYLTLKIVACGFIKSYVVTTKIGFFSYMMPCWVHKMHLMFKCVFNPELVGGLYIVMEQLDYNKQFYVCLVHKHNNFMIHEQTKIVKNIQMKEYT